MVRQHIYPGCCITTSVSKQKNRDIGMEVEERYGRYYITTVGAIFTRNEVPLEEGDKILALNGKNYDEYPSVYEVCRELKIADRITLVVMRRDPYASDSSASTNDEQMVLYDQDMMDDVEEDIDLREHNQYDNRAAPPSSGRHTKYRSHRVEQEDEDDYDDDEDYLQIENPPSKRYGDIRPGDIMILHGLQAKPELNGARVKIIQEDLSSSARSASGRWEVKHLSTGEHLSIAPHNLKPMSSKNKGGGSGGPPGGRSGGEKSHSHSSWSHSHYHYSSGGGSGKPPSSRRNKQQNQHYDDDYDNPAAHHRQMKLGSIMQLDGLEQKPKMNGQYVKVLEEDTTKQGRWNVQLLDTNAVISISEDKLIPAN